MVAAAVAAWALALVAEMACSIAYSYKLTSDQPRFYAKGILALRILVIVLVGVNLSLMAQNDQVLAPVGIFLTTLVAAFLANYFAYARQIRMKAARMDHSRDALEVQRYRHTAKWTIDLEIKEGLRRR